MGTARGSAGASGTGKLADDAGTGGAGAAPLLRHAALGQRDPSLRNIAVTAPYMHDGSVATLEAVLDHYAAGGRAPNARQSKSIEPLTLDESNRRDLIAFLESLTDRQALRDPRWRNPWAGREAKRAARASN